MTRWTLAGACFVLFIAVGGCGPGESLRLPHEATGEPPAFSVIYIVHGDGNYLYHAADGSERYADAVVVSQAGDVGRNATAAEVFVFHQKPARTFLLFFPRDDGELTIYRGGREVYRTTYRWSRPDERFAPEAELYREFSALPSGVLPPIFHRFLLYFGHEIPEGTEALYDVSHDDGVLSMGEFAAGAARFAGPARARRPFDLILLSTCNNGTPGVVHALSPLADLIVASPDDLHLTHIDTRTLGSLQEGIPVDIRAAVDTLVHAAFARLTAATRTVVTLAVYDVEKTKPYVDAVMPFWSGVRAGEVGGTNEDCAVDERFRAPAMSDGVTLLYRPPAFGRGKNRAHHSGWGCPHAANQTVGADPAPEMRP